MAGADVDREKGKRWWWWKRKEKENWCVLFFVSLFYFLCVCVLGWAGMPDSMPWRLLFIQMMSRFSPYWSRASRKTKRDDFLCQETGHDSYGNVSKEAAEEGGRGSGGRFLFFRKKADDIFDLLPLWCIHTVFTPHTRPLPLFIYVYASC